MKPFQVDLDSDDVAENLLRTFAALYGFDLQAWDAWVSQLDSCGAKKELAERREKAKRASSSAEMLRHLEWMVSRRREIKREDFLLPLARTGNKVLKKSQEGNAKLKREADTQHAGWQAKAAKLWAQPQHAQKGKSAIARLIDPERWNTARHFISKPEK